MNLSRLIHNLPDTLTGQDVAELHDMLLDDGRGRVADGLREIFLDGRTWSGADALRGWPFYLYCTHTRHRSYLVSVSEAQAQDGVVWDELFYGYGEGQRPASDARYLDGEPSFGLDHVVLSDDPEIECVEFWRAEPTVASAPGWDQAGFTGIGRKASGPLGAEGLIKFLVYLGRREDGCWTVLRRPEVGADGGLSGDWGVRRSLALLPRPDVG